ncbi:MAG TPA: FAD-dependent oxidoreductase [Candidatus Dormibacteraeota bacterium]|jgi:glycerol-3-phosphate dehydrogenase|nr:FAD-dependent oxidoreductase [Candidatus Dormibacteraeota bacterium]
MNSRTKTLEIVGRTEFDLCVIGGGATGAGTALDAQLRGLRTVLVDAGDFASGTSSASTKLVHGGVRYLEQAVKSFDLTEYRMVQHALRERTYMLGNAPHLAHAAEFLVPVYSWLQAGYFRIGLKMYDLLAGKKNIFPSKFLTKKETLARLPGLKPDGLHGAVAYADGQFDDARYGLALVRSFQEAGGIAANYLRVTDFVREGTEKISGVVLQDLVAEAAVSLKAKTVVNATGPFSDKIRQLANRDATPRLRPSKGVHLLFPMDLFPGKDALLVPQTEDKRVIFAVPWQQRLLVGTTEDEATPETRMIVRRNEADYLMRQLNPYLMRPLRVEQAVSGISGLRPLVAAKTKHETKELIRDHEVEVDEKSGMISILGGKWTTHRLMAEDTVNTVQHSLGVEISPCMTKLHPLDGATGFSEDYWQTLAQSRGLTEATAKRLANKFGTNAAKVLMLAKANGWLNKPLIDGFPALRAEVIYCAREEMAQTIEDVLARRLGLQMYDWRASIAAAPIVGELLATELSWSNERKSGEISGYVTKLRAYLKELGLSEA